MDDMIEEPEMIHILKEQCNLAGSQAEFASQSGFSTAYINEVLSRKRPVSERLATALGYTRIKRFVKEK